MKASKPTAEPWLTPSFRSRAEEENETHGHEDAAKPQVTKKARKSVPRGRESAFVQRFLNE